MNTNFKPPCPRLGNILCLGKWKRSALKQTWQLMQSLCQRNGLSKVRLGFVRSSFIRIVKCCHEEEMIFTFDFGLIQRGKVRPQLHHLFFNVQQAARSQQPLYFSGRQGDMWGWGGGGVHCFKIGQLLFAINRIHTFLKRLGK